MKTKILIPKPRNLDLIKQQKAEINQKETMPVCFVCGKPLTSGYACKQHKDDPKLTHSRFRGIEGRIEIV